MLNIQFSAKPNSWDDYRPALAAAFQDAGIAANLASDHPPEAVDYIIHAPNGPVQDFTPYTNARAVMNLWAGVDSIVGNKTLTIPLVRMVDPSLTAGMVEWVTGHALRHHLGMDTHINGQDGIWRDDVYPPLAADRPIAILGLGALGQACGHALATLGFPISGWSRNAKSVDNITCYHGTDGLKAALSNAQIIVLLLPKTPDTTHIINAETLAQMPKGAFIINPGRGPLIGDDALLAALDSGHIAHATLDVFATEPLPADHPYWAHPNVTVTPHIAAATRAKTSAQTIAKNILLDQAGKPMPHTVDRKAGY